MEQKTKNIDALINKIGFDLVNERVLDENQINKMLGVLTTDGVYAMWVYSKEKLNWKFMDKKELFSEQKLIKLLLHIEPLTSLFNPDSIIKDKIDDICQKQKKINELQKEMKQMNNKKDKKDKKETINKLHSEKNKLLNDFFLELSKNLNQLLFFKELLEKTLTYARYHAKAMGD